MIPQNPQESERMELIGDDWLLSSKDYLEPICYADESEAVKFARSHYCAVCLNQLDYKPDDLASGYVVFCRECGEITRSNTVTGHTAEVAQSNIIAGRMEIYAVNAPKRTEDEILKELGF